MNNDEKIGGVLDYRELMCSTYYSICSDLGELRRALIFDGKVTKGLARSLKLIYPFDYPFFVSFMGVFVVNKDQKSALSQQLV